MLEEIMDELVATLADSLGSLVEAVSLYEDSPTPPCVDVYWGDPFANSDTAGFQVTASDAYFTVRARVNTADLEEGFRTLTRLADPWLNTGIAVILEDDQTLNGYASAVSVTGPSGLRSYIDEGGQRAYLGCEWSVRVLPAAS